MRCSTRPVAVRWARDQGVVAKNLVHSNADQTSDWICILTPQMQMPKNDGNRWKQLERNLSPRKQKKRNMQTTQCSAHHKQNPSELKVDSSSPLNHQWARDFTALQRNYGDFLILWSFSVSKHPLPSRGSTQKVLNLPGSKIGTLSAVDQDTTTVGGACPSLVIGSRKWSKSVPTDHKNWSINHGRPNNKPSSIEDYYWVYSVVGHL